MIRKFLGALMQQNFETVNRVVRLITVGNRIGVKRVFGMFW